MNNTNTNTFTITIMTNHHRQPDALRDEGGFRREYDGRLWLSTRAGGWMEARLDAKLPGTVLLRNEADGAVYYVTYNAVQQVKGARVAAHDARMCCCGGPDCVKQETHRAHAHALTIYYHYTIIITIT